MLHASDLGLLSKMVLKPMNATNASGKGCAESSGELSTVVERLRTDYSSALVVVHSERTEHISYWDASTKSLDAAVISDVQRQGFEILDTGKRLCGETGEKQEWMEARRYDPADIYGGDA